MHNLHTADEDRPPSDIARANFRLFVLDIAWFGLAFPSTASFLSVYAIRLDASPALLGWLAALPAIAALISSSLAGMWRKRYAQTVQALFWPAITYRLVFLLPAFTPIFPHEWQTIWILIAAVLPAFPQGIASIMFLVMLREGTENSRIPALMSRRSMIFNVTVAIATLAFGFWLEKAPFPQNYQVMYVTAFVFSLVSLLSALRVRTFAPQPALPSDQTPVKPFRSRAFRRVVWVTVITHVALFSIGPIITLQLVDELGADEGFMSIFSLMGLITAALMSGVANRIVTRIGSGMAITLGMIGIGLSSIGLALAPNLYITLPAGALGGATWTLASISLFIYFSDNTPAESLTRFTTVYNQVVMLSIFVGPMIGTQLASLGMDLVVVLLVGSAMRILAGIAVSTSELARFVRQRRALVAARRTT